MKILHLVESLDRGGLERIVINLVLAQRDAGHEVAVCCLFHPGKLAVELTTAGIRVTSAAKSSGLDIKALQRVRREMLGLGVSILHTHNAVANYYGALAALATDVCIVNTRHGMGFVGKPDRREQLFKLSMLRTSAVALVCAAARLHFVKSGVVRARQAHVVRNGIDTSRFQDTTYEARLASRRSLGLSADALVIGTVGRLNWAKNHALLIDSFAMVASRNPQARLVIIGDGELRQQLTEHVRRSAVADRILMVGDRNDVPSLLPAMDIFALTSTTEGYSVALLEAAAAGLPTVATDVGGNKEIVQHGVTGQVVAEAQPAAVAQAIEQIANDAATLKEMSARARSWVRQHGSTTSMAHSYDLLYAQCLKPEIAGVAA